MNSASVSVIPRIETSRLVLRAHRPEDLDDCIAMWSDPLVTRWIGGRPFTREQVWSRILRYVGHWALLGYGYWLVCDKDSGRFVGEVGLADFKRQLDVDKDAEIAARISGVPELGWAIAPWAHGRGLGTEAALAVLEWGAAHLSAKRTVCLISPENTPSMRVAAKCGYKEVGRLTYHDEPTVVFERTVS